MPSAVMVTRFSSLLASLALTISDVCDFNLVNLQVFFKKYVILELCC